MKPPTDDETDPVAEDERWLTINGRRWRRTDPCLPNDIVEALKSHLGRGRSAVKVAKKSGDDALIVSARRRVGLAKHGLGERGPYWWEDREDDRIARARSALADLDALEAQLASPGSWRAVGENTGFGANGTGGTTS